jgi:hypothetical protein
MHRSDCWRSVPLRKLALCAGASFSDKRKATIESSHSIITAQNLLSPEFLAEFVQICRFAIDKFEFLRQ